MRKGLTVTKIVLGPAVIACLGGILALLSHQGLIVPNPVLFFSLGIVLSAFLGGYTSGLIGVGLSFVFVLLYWSTPGHLLAYTDRNISRLIIFLLTMPAMAILVGALEKKNRLRIQDIEKKTQALQESERRLQRAERVAEIGNWEICIPDGPLGKAPLYASPGAQAVYGIDASYTTLGQVQHIPLPQYRKPLAQALQALIAGFAPYDLEFKILRPCDGQALAIHSRATYDPETRKIFGTIQNITARKAIEADLVESREKAELASRAKSAFLANMSHEIRTPLNGILGMLQTLEDTELSAAQSQHVAAAIEASRRLTRLLNDILDLSRVEAGKMEISRAPFSCASLVTAIQDIFRTAARQQGVSLRCSVSEDTPSELVGDEVRIRQILFNLIGNAIKFAPDGTVTLTIFPVRLETLSCRLLFVVADNGIGIAESLMARLCQPFVQATTGLPRPTHGVGLGLSIVVKLVALMDGEITIESEPGQGTAVSVSLPLGLAPAKQPAATIRQRPDPGLTQGLRILLAEDDTISAIACRHLLEKMGHTVTLATTGQEAIAAFANAPFDCVLMDIELPELNGLEATKTIRDPVRFGSRAQTPIIAMTAYAMENDRQRFLAAGMDDYVAKPVDKTVLRETIARAMQTRRG